LHALKDDDRLRGLKPRAGIDFVSNDYLVLASAPRMKRAVSAALEAGTPIGARGSRPLRANCEDHESPEAEAARFFGAETAFFFGSGYVANFAILTTLPQRGDLPVLDSLVRARVACSCWIKLADRPPGRPTATGLKPRAIILRRKHSNADPWTLHRRNLAREPHGVTGHIIPWKYPTQIISRSVGPALAVGNACVVKPAEDASLTALALARLAEEAGFPAGALNIVTGLGEEAGAALAAYPGVGHISFTGSPEVGTLIQRPPPSTAFR
jgi:hypothetical protein